MRPSRLTVEHIARALRRWQSNQDPKAGNPPMTRLPDVQLTEEELGEFKDQWRALFPPTADGAWAMREDLIEPFKLNMMAMCLIGRAERFALLARTDSQYRARAYEAGAKACALYPLSAYFYDFAAILEQFGSMDEARTLYAQFLRQPEAGPVREVDELTLHQRDIAQMVAHAREALAS